MDRAADEHLKRAACQIASQLPDDVREALIVLSYAKAIICNLGKTWGASDAVPLIRLVSEHPQKDQEAL